MSALRAALLFVVTGCFVLSFGGGCGDKTCTKDADCALGQTCKVGVCKAKNQDESAAKEPDSTDSGLPPCPKFCQNDRDCVFCGDRKTCDLDTNTCVDIRTQCPKLCNQDADCSRPGCGTRTTCNKDIGECVERIQECPDQCGSDDDCKAAGCGPRNQCSARFKTCVDPTVANCPFSCKDDAGCKECGKRNKCSFSTPTSTIGICREFGSHACPSFCRSAGDCFTSGCQDKIYCNYALGVCVNKDQICALSCQTDADCSKNCGSRTFCYISAPGLAGYCATPPTQDVCPSSCRSSFSCKAKSCGDKVFCNYKTNTCVTAKDACPGPCKTDADCPKSKCGDTARCRRGRCYHR